MAAAAVTRLLATHRADAAYSEMDLKSNNVIFHKARISQGSMSIAADQAQGSGLDFDNSHWVFRGNVKITMEQGTRVR